MTPQTLEAQGRARSSRQNQDVPVFVAGDGEANYQKVYERDGAAADAPNVKKVGLMSQPKQGGRKRVKETRADTAQALVLALAAARWLLFALLFLGLWWTRSDAPVRPPAPVIEPS